MAGTDTAIVFFLFVIVILLGVLLFFIATDKLEENDSTPTGNVVKDYYFIEDKSQYDYPQYQSSCLNRFFSCLLSCPEDNDDEDLLKESCTDDCEDNLYYSCSQGVNFEGENAMNINKYQCLENCYDSGSYDQSCTRNCVY